MNRKVNIFLLIAAPLSFLACQKSSEEGGKDNNVSETYQDIWQDAPRVNNSDDYSLPKEFIEAFTPDTISEKQDELTVEEIWPDTIEVSGKDILTIKGNDAILCVEQTMPDHYENTVRQEIFYLIFRRGDYSLGSTDYSVKDDGIYRNLDGENVLKLENYRYKLYTQNEVISKRKISGKDSYIMQSSANDIMTFDKNDTTFRCSRLSDKEFLLEMIRPVSNSFGRHILER